MCHERKSRFFDSLMPCAAAGCLALTRPPLPTRTCGGYLCRHNLEGRFMLYLERYRARDKAFSGSGVVQAARDVLVRAGRELRVRPQRDAFQLPSAVRALYLHARGVVAVCYDDDASVSAKVEVPELMTGGKRGDKQL